MAKLVVKVTVYQDVDPDLFDSVSRLPPRQRAAVIRRLWRQGLGPGSCGVGGPGPEDSPRPVPTGQSAVSVGAPPEAEDTGSRLLREHLTGPGLPGLSAFV